MIGAVKLAVLLNAGAGTAAKLGDDASRRVEDAFAASGVVVEATAVPPGDMAQMVGKLAAGQRAATDSERLDGIVVGGGDGTLSCAAGVLAGTGLPLGVLPLGTLNHFAKDLGIPQDIDAAAATIAAGHVRAVDVAELNGRVFVNNSSVGIYPFLVAEREAGQKRHGLGKLAALGPALLSTFRSSSWHYLDLVAGGDRRALRTPCVFVGNNFYDIGAMGARRSLDAGELCLYLVKQQTWLGLIVLPFKVALGLADPAHDVELIRVPAVEIRSGHGTLRVALDGETTRMAPPLSYRVRPGGLDVFAPPPAANDAA